MNVTPVMRVRGRYRDFAILETPTLGALGPRQPRGHQRLRGAEGGARASRCSSSPPASTPTRCRRPTATPTRSRSSSSTRTTARACPPTSRPTPRATGGAAPAAAPWPTPPSPASSGDTAEATMAFAATRPADIPRIALVDFRNDCVGHVAAGHPDHVPRATSSSLQAGRRRGGAQVQALRRAPRHLRATCATCRCRPSATSGSTAASTRGSCSLMREAIDREWETWPPRGRGPRAWPSSTAAT